MSSSKYFTKERLQQTDYEIWLQKREREIELLKKHVRKYYKKIEQAAKEDKH